MTRPTDSPEDPKPFKLWKWIAFVALIWAATIILQFVGPTEFNAGAFGDSFGVTNSLFSGLAFALLIYNTWMQRQELKLQREELTATREELSLTRISQQKHVELIESQIRDQKTKRESDVLPVVEILGVLESGQVLRFQITSKVNRLLHIRTVIFENKVEHPIVFPHLPRYFDAGAAYQFHLTATPDIKEWRRKTFSIRTIFKNIDGKSYFQDFAFNGITDVSSNLPMEFDDLIFDPIADRYS